LLANEKCVIIFGNGKLFNNKKKKEKIKIYLSKEKTSENELEQEL
jgi:hypothetical protein